MAVVVGPPMGTAMMHAPSPESEPVSEEEDELEAAILVTLRDVLDVAAREKPEESTSPDVPKSPPTKRACNRQPAPDDTVPKRPDRRDATCEEMRRYEDWYERQLTEKWRRERPYKAVFEQWKRPPPYLGKKKSLPPHDYTTDYDPTQSSVYRLKKMFSDVNNNTV